MPIKITLNTAAMLTNLPEIQAEFNAAVADELPVELDTQIQAGLSPVAGEGRFQDYSETYKERITEDDGVIMGTDGQLNTGKRLRPVNLTVSGAMLASKVVTVQDNRVNLAFASEFAGYHNAGSNRLPRRAILPSNSGEKFSSTITRFLVNIAKGIVARNLRSR